jgi:hypothetical protein
VAVRPIAPFDTFASGDGNDKAYVWKLQPKMKVGPLSAEAQAEKEV